MSKNSLIATALLQREMEKRIYEWTLDAKARAAAIDAFAAANNVGVGMVRLDYYGLGKFRARMATPEELWMDWQSDNHDAHECECND